ncbi:hypothetical protein HON36_02925 [Candidatus Parcubacteria bacterium]|jgi:hypothetical protein|nr:hypothetical protein [Candidatus Parcubacteria bacterium]MBT7228576.1 hypothetical protein [Candidatus Parcubacteria bacterium]
MDMTGPIIVLIIRLVVPLSILKYPFWGTVASLLVDALDVVMITFIGVGAMPEGWYTPADKILDSYYLIFSFIVSLRWADRLPKKISIILFVYRIIGVILMEITNIRILLFFFPNMFENFFLFWEARNKWFKRLKPTKKNLTIALIALLIPKMFQEWMLHWKLIDPWSQIEEMFNLHKSH